MQTFNLADFSYNTHISCRLYNTTSYPDHSTPTFHLSNAKQTFHLAIATQAFTLDDANSSSIALIQHNHFK